MVDTTAYLYLLPALALCVTLGANNLSTCLGTSMSTSALRYSQALVLASLGLLAGVFFEGSKLSLALTSGIVVSPDPHFMIDIALSTFIIMTLLTIRKLPISLSQVIVGSAIGAAFATGISVNWQFIAIIALSWLLTPSAGFLIAGLFTLVTRSLAKRVRRILALNALYAYLTICSGIYASYTLGANTLGLIIGLGETARIGRILISGIFAAATILGMVAFSRGTTRSVAENIVGLSPSAAFAAQMGGALTVQGFTEVGVPVSLSQAVVGGIFGAAMPRKIVVRNERLVREIVAGWTVAPFVGALLGFILSSIV